jgi:PBP1b-binding outer membrane lipoprotein LpoB
MHAVTGKWLIALLVSVFLSGCVMMSAPELDFKGIIVNKKEPPEGCAPKGNLVATSIAMIESIGDEPAALNRKAMQDLINQADDVEANYVYVADHRQYSNQPRKGLVSRVVMKANAFYCPSLDIAQE